MQLSKRLFTVANQVTKGNRVADIGCDHAYTSIYLIKNNIAPFVIAMDINEGPLKIAKSNISKYQVDSKISLRLSNGAKRLEENEVDTILIAGMGGALIKTILSDSENVVKKCSEIVLQPQSENYLVRDYLHEIGFKIVNEEMLLDAEKKYVVIKAIKGEEQYARECERYFGKCLLETKNKILKDYLNHELSLCIKILNQLEDVDTLHSNQRLIEVNEMKDRILEGLAYYEM